MLSFYYVKAAVASVEESCIMPWRILETIAYMPISSSYVPDMDRIPELNDIDMPWYQELI